MQATAFNGGNSSSSTLFDYLAAPEEDDDIQYQWVPLSEVNSTDYQPFVVSGTVPACITFSEADKEAFYNHSTGPLLLRQPQRRYYHDSQSPHSLPCSSSPALAATKGQGTTIFL